MNQTEVTSNGLRHVRPGREATTGVNVGAGAERGAEQAAPAPRPARGEQPMVPAAQPRSYFGMPVINQPVWESPDIPGYLFLGGLAGAGSVMAAAAQATGRPALARVLKTGNMVGAGLSLVALVHDLGRRGRFFNMLRTFKLTSPMSVGSWLLAGFVPMATVSAMSDLSQVAPGLGTLATAGAAVLGPGVATYTAALISDTAVPAWHDAYRDMPFVFAASAVTSAAALGLMGAPVDECGPARILGAGAGLAELAAEKAMELRAGVAEGAYKQGKAKKFHTVAQGLLVGGVVAAVVGARSRMVSALAGAALLGGSAMTRFAIFEAGLVSAKDPEYTVAPQRARLNERGRKTEAPAGEEPGARGRSGDAGGAS